MRRRAYGRDIALGTPITGAGVGKVVETRSTRFAIGDTVAGAYGWQEYAVVHELAGTMMKIDPTYKPSHTLGVLGMPGATAYFGFLEVCHPRPGDVVFVTGAAGAVGALVGQIAKLTGCFVVGSAGGAAKVKQCLELGYDACIDYKGKDTDALEAELRALVATRGGGVDCFFDNTGGAMSDAVMLCMSQFGRVSVCGQIALYNAADQKRVTGAPILMNLLAKQVKAEGFIVTRWKDNWPLAFRHLHAWIKEGKIRVTEDVTDGIENMFKAFLTLFSGENNGKKLVRVSAECDA